MDQALPQSTPSGILPVGALLRHAWETFSGHLKQYLPLSIVVIIFPVIISALTANWLTDLPQNPTAADWTALTNQLSTNGPLIGLIFFVAVIAAAVLGVLGALAMIHVAKDSSRSAGQALKASLGQFWSYLWIAVLIFLFVVGVMLSAGIILAVLVKLANLLGSASVVFGAILGGLALVAAAVYVVYQTVRWTFAYYILVDEGLTGRTALRRSAAVVTNRWWAVVGRFIVLGLIVMVAQMIIGAVLSAAGGALGTMVAQFLINIVVAPISIIYAYTIYHNLRANQH
ncbi:MAG: hypothetical protein AAB817_03045 [Patescibacteria group bacterium]